MRTHILISALLRSVNRFACRISWLHMLSIPMDTGHTAAECFHSFHEAQKDQDLRFKCLPANPGKWAVKGSSSAPLLAKEHLAQLALKEGYEDKEMPLCTGQVEVYHTERADWMNCWTTMLSPQPANSTLPGGSTGLGQAWSLLVFLPAFSYLWWRECLC